MTSVGRRLLASSALVLGLGALVRGDPGAGTAEGARALLEALPEDARIAPLELARRIRAGDRRLVLVDLRSGEAFQDYHIPRARHAPLPRIEETGVPAGALAVLYGDHAGELLEARDRLLANGAGEVRLLDGGVGAWIRQVMNPTLPDDADEETRRAFLEAAEVSRYFGGMPRIVPREELEGGGGTVQEMVEEMRLRGCRGG